MGKTTDKLISLANEISTNVPKREMDMLFAVGEQITVSLMAMAFDTLGIPAVSLNAFQVRMITDNNYRRCDYQKNRNRNNRKRTFR